MFVAVFPLCCSTVYICCSRVSYFSCYLDDVRNKPGWWWRWWWCVFWNTLSLTLFWMVIAKLLFMNGMCRPSTSRCIAGTVRPESSLQFTVPNQNIRAFSINSQAYSVTCFLKYNINILYFVMELFSCISRPPQLELRSKIKYLVFRHSHYWCERAEEVIVRGLQASITLPLMR